MTVRKCIAWFAALLAVACIGLAGVSIGSAAARATTFGMTLAEDDVPGDKSLIEGEPATPSDDQAQTGSHAPKYPIKFKTVDYQDSGDTGKLTLAGTAPPESPVYIYFDEEPLVKVLADKDGNWSAEKEVKLDDQRHMLRAEQYDTTTRMVSGRATVMLARAPADAGTPAPDNPAPPATSP